MADLIAQGPELQQRWRRALPTGENLVLGRSEGTWAVPWDKKISRQHAELIWREGKLAVRRLPTARNAIIVRGRDLTTFDIRAGEHFTIGETTFTLADDRVSVVSDAPQPVEQKSYAIQDLQSVRYRNAEHRIDVLSRLPKLIQDADNDNDLLENLVNMLLAGIPRADAVAIVSVDPTTKERTSLRILHWDRRGLGPGDFRPSEQLILEAMRRSQSVSYVWSGSSMSHTHEFTMAYGVDWAFCTPVLGECAEGWGIYVVGKFGIEAAVNASLNSEEANDLRDDLKFTELVASILCALRQVRKLQRRQAELNQFFSPLVINHLANEDPAVVLQPRLTEVSVLFCDLRGFSQVSEMGSDDLIGLLKRVSQALRVMTYNILDFGGVIGDFQGDAAMGFWGWPIDQGDSPRRACLAALEIRKKFEANAREKGHPLEKFKMGIGIASGKAVAGKIGTEDQYKVSVFGPVVNQASRLEGMTKIMRTQILIDEETARIAREQISPQQARLRRLAKVRPAGMKTELLVSEVLPPVADFPILTDDHLKYYEDALHAFQEGEWAKAYNLLSRIPPEDVVKDFLTGFILQRDRVPPDDWKGVIELNRKS